MTSSIRPLAHTNGRFFWLMVTVPVTRKVSRLASLKVSK
jgi:hypothetical protein